MTTPVQIYRGDTWLRSWSPKGPDGEAVDLTGASARLVLRDKAGATVVEATDANGLLVITPTPGAIALEVPFADIEDLAPGQYNFNLKITYASGRRQTYERAPLIILAD